MWVPLDQTHDLCVANTKWATLHTALLVVFLIFSESSFHFFVISVRQMAFMSVHTSPSYCLIRAEWSPYTDLTFALPAGHSLWWDACRHTARTVCSCHVYIPVSLIFLREGLCANSSNMPGQVCGWDGSQLWAPLRAILRDAREKEMEKGKIRSKESLENAWK